MIPVVLDGFDKLTFEMLKNFCVVLVALYAFNEVVTKIIDKIGKYKQNKVKVENFDPEAFKRDMELYLDSKHRLITEKYDDELKEIRDDLQDNHTEYVALIQEIKSELYLQTECNAVIMDGLVQLDCNGPVKEMKKRMDSFMNRRAHDVSTEEG